MTRIEWPPVSHDQKALMVITWSMIGFSPPAAGSVAVAAFGITAIAWFLTWPWKAPARVEVTS